jgi:HK97 gp10 family phage protein
MVKLMADVEINMIGMKELEAMLRSMPDQFNYKFLTGAHKEILKKNLLPVAQLLAPVGTKRVVSKKYASRTHDPGNLRASLGVGLAPRSRKNAGVWCGPRAEYFRGAKKNNAYYAHMVEFGHEGVSPHPFMRPAFDQTKKQMIASLGDTLIKRMTRQVKRFNINAHR